MVKIYVDADACPVKNEIERIASRHNLKTYLVCNGGIRPSQNPMIELVVVGIGADAANDWITCHISRADICVTADILLAARCLNEGAFVIKPNGYIFDDNNIGMALSAREIREGMSSVGNFAGGPAPFSEADRSEYLNRMEIIVRAAKKSDSKST